MVRTHNKVNTKTVVIKAIKNLLVEFQTFGVFSDHYVQSATAIAQHTVTQILHSPQFS